MSALDSMSVSSANMNSMNYRSPILPAHFRLLTHGAGCTGSTVHNTDIANSRKWLVSVFGGVSDNYQGLQNPVYNCNPPDDPVGRLTQLLNLKFPQLVILENSFIRYYINKPGMKLAIYNLIERSYMSGNYEYPISVIVTVQYARQIPPELLKYFNFTDLAGEKGVKNRREMHKKLVPHISQHEFVSGMNGLQNYNRLHVNNTQRAATVHDSNTLHIPAKL